LDQSFILAVEGNAALAAWVRGIGTWIVVPFPCSFEALGLAQCGHHIAGKDAAVLHLPVAQFVELGSERAALDHLI
jgi:hypothetical protein